VLAARTSASRSAYISALLLPALCLAIACFAFGSLPTAQVRWRRGAAFLAYQRANITTVGALCLIGAAILFALSRN
jgi:hypothetical protein